jgi:hypothetical protein
VNECVEFGFEFEFLGALLCFVSDVRDVGVDCGGGMGWRGVVYNDIGVGREGTRIPNLMV